MGAKTYGWKEVGRDMHTASERVVEDGKKIVGKGCLQIKKQAQQTIRDHSHRGYLPHYPRSISYDVTAHAADIIGEAGPDAAKLQGGLARLLEFGSIHNAPIPHLIPALDDEEPKFARYVAELGEKLLNGQAGPDGPVTDPGGG
jgi:hypothetical protein